MLRYCLALALAIAPLAGLSASETIRVNHPDLRPLIFSENAQVEGLAAELVRLLERHSDGRLTLTFSESPWARAQLNTQRSAHDLIVPLSLTEQRRAHYSWLVPLYAYRFVLATTGERADWPLERLRQGRIGYLKGNAIEPELPALGLPRVEPVTLENLNVNKLMLGRIDAWLVADLALRPLLQASSIDPARVHVGPPIGERKVVYLAGPLNYPADLRAALEEAAASMRRDPAYAAILRRYEAALP
ncbi:substrate-binding periplasmic protein [Pseudomonas panipatensis]|uniref:substrate-binding periplasmic protein n=1 Tax=Pseudomonas panipatensis TaxID=428992 RepID=UPI0035B39C38